MSFEDAASFWNSRFDSEEFIFGTEANEYLKEKSQEYFHRFDRVLCVADGEGRNSVWLASQGMDVVAFDFSEVALKKAHELAKQSGVAVQYSLADADGWNWEPDQYDGVVAIFVQFADPQMRSRLFKNIVRTLKSGGVLVLLGYTPKQLEYKTGGPSLIEHLYTEQMLLEEFSSMHILELESWEGLLNEGLRHSGMSALLGMVVRKP